jgi:hypothetical protein
MIELQIVIDALQEHSRYAGPKTVKALSIIRKMMQAKPVAWAIQSDDGLVLDVITPEEHDSYEGEYTLPLYAAPKETI